MELCTKNSKKWKKLLVNSQISKLNILKLVEYHWPACSTQTCSYPTVGGIIVHHVKDLKTRKDKTAELEVSCTEHLANYATSLSNLPTTRKGINIITQQEQPKSKQVCTWASPADHYMSAWLNTCTMPRPWTLVHILPNTGCYTTLPLTPCHHLNTR